MENWNKSERRSALPEQKEPKGDTALKGAWVRQAIFDELKRIEESEGHRFHPGWFPKVVTVQLENGTVLDIEYRLDATGEDKSIYVQRGDGNGNFRRIQWNDLTIEEKRQAIDGTLKGRTTKRFADLFPEYGE